MARSAKLVQANWPFTVALPGQVFDFIILPPCDETELEEILRDVLPLVGEHGAFGLLSKPCLEAGEAPLALLKVAEGFGLLALRTHMSEADGRTQWGFTLVRGNYDPVVHAAALEQAGFRIRAFSVLESISEFAELSEEQSAILAGEKHRLLHDAILEKPADASAANLLSFARKEFQIAVHSQPLLHAAYRRQAALWHHFGEDDLAARLLRSVCHVKDDPESRALLETLNARRHIHVETETAPVWSAARRNPRILAITHDNSDYGMDSLYDGLCRVLGNENVVEFPWKPTLHGQSPETELNYPCVFDYPGEPRGPVDFVAELGDGRFDLILFADVVQHAYRDTVRQFLAAAGDVPVVVYDPWDDSHSLLPGALDYLGRPTVAAYFKREMLSGFDYGPNSFPLPFGYPDGLVPEDVSWERTGDLFWAGKRLFGTRSLYLDHLAARLGRDLEQRYSQEEYRDSLQRARIGLSLFGYGYDTVRYWELPAHGVMLLAERPPLRIPHDFVDGESAVFFDDLSELEERLDYYLAHPDEATRIAKAGREHFLRYHTTSSRARQLLGRLERIISW